MEKTFYWLGGIGAFILLIVSITTTPNAFEWIELTVNSYPMFFINWAMYCLVYCLILYGMYWLIKKISIKKVLKKGV